MISLDITEDQISRAKKLYDFYDIKDSITRGKSQLWGALGEVITADFLGKEDMEVRFESTKDYDLIINGKTVDVKTKKTTVKPLHYYWCSIASTSLHQDCDFYFFVRILENLKKGYMLGYMPQKQFFKEATFFKKGEIDPIGNGKWTFTADCYNIQIKDLIPFQEK